MTSTAILACWVLLLQHAVVSAKAGYVTYAHGSTNSGPADYIEEGRRFRTYRKTLIEAMLNPGSYLRIDENSEIVLESAALNRIAIRLETGSIVIDAVGVGKNNPITVFSEDFEIRIVKPGVYRFSDGTANVLEGKLEVPARQITVEKGWKLFWFETKAERTRIEKWESHPLERWSRYRSSLIYAKQERRVVTLPSGHVVR